MLNNNCWRQPVPNDMYKEGKDSFNALDRAVFNEIIMTCRREEKSETWINGKNRVVYNFMNGETYFVISRFAEELGTTAYKVKKSLDNIVNIYKGITYKAIGAGFIISVSEFDKVTEMKTVFKTDLKQTSNIIETELKQTSNILQSNMNKTVETVKTDKIVERVGETKVSSATQKHKATQGILATLANRVVGDVYQKIIEYTMARGIPTSKQAEDLLESFAEYWLETDARGKHRYQKEKTYDIKRRLNTWISNSDRFDPKAKEQEYVSPF